MRISEDISGLLLIDKPHGWTSFDCIARVRGVLEKGLRERGLALRGFPGKRLKVGHSGTLDPFATGLLVLAIGKATKRIETLKGFDKDYVFEVVFGVESPTFDLDAPEGEIKFSDLLSGEWHKLSDTARAEGLRGEIRGAATIDLLETTLDEFRGEISQIPPIFSALKVDGRRAYDLARSGKDFKLESRKVTISKLDIIENSLKEVSVAGCSKRLPVVKLFATVSSGTYIRALARDLGKKFEIPACVLNLCRTRVGDMSLNGTVPVVKLSKETTFEEIVEAMIGV